MQTISCRRILPSLLLQTYWINLSTPSVITAFYHCDTYLILCVCDWHFIIHFNKYSSMEKGFKFAWDDARYPVSCWKNQPSTKNKTAVIRLFYTSDLFKNTKSNKQWWVENNISWIKVSICKPIMLHIGFWRTWWNPFGWSARESHIRELQRQMKERIQTPASK